MEEKRYDVIVIGSGPAGMTATLYASRSNLKTLLIEKGVPGGEMLNTAEIENYPGFSSILGPDLADKMYQGAMQFQAEYTYGQVQSVEDKGVIKLVHTSKQTYETYAVVIATGSHHRKLGVPGEEELAGRGVSYCAVCDGAFFKDKHLYVIGGGDSAVEEGGYLTQFASQVTIVHRRDRLRAQPILQQRAFANEKINFIWNSGVEEIIGTDGKVSSLRLKNLETGEVTQVDADGIFIYVGLLPVSDPFKELGITNEQGWIETDNQMRTRIPGIFAIGDVREKTLRQVATAVGDGGQAGQSVFQYVEEIKEQERS